MDATASLSSFSSIAPLALRDLLLAPQELALLDVREARAYVGAHLTLARLAPLSTLELDVRALVPRLSTAIVLVDDEAANGLASRAAQLLAALGYTDLRVLAGGTLAWLASGLPLIDGYGTLVKAFGDRVRQHHATPILPVDTLQTWRATGRAPLSIDARPADEYAYLALPDSHNHAGTELALRDWTDADAQPWVINCFSRTRGIIATTTLRLLGHPDARLLEDGVMQWALHGAPVVQDASPRPALPAAPDKVLRLRAKRLIDTCDLPLLEPAALTRFQAETDRTLYVFDLRPDADTQDLPENVRAVAGGQLLMHFENLIGTRNARIVLLDDPHRLRAVITAFWLRQLNQAEVFILDGELPAAWTQPAPSIDDSTATDDTALSPRRLAGLLREATERTHIVDVAPSSEFERAHLPGAFFLLPYSMEPLAPIAKAGDRIVITSTDGKAARVAARHAAERWPDCDVHWLIGGTQAWQALALSTEQAWQPSQLLTPFEDDWGSVMRVPASQRDTAWTDYLAWERSVGARVANDPTVSFRLF